MFTTGFRGALCAAVLIAIATPALSRSPLEASGDRERGPSLKRSATFRLAQAQPATRTYKAGTLVIEEPWSRATPAGAKVASGYLRITNTGSAPDRLVGGSIPLSGRFEVHASSMEGDVIKMRALEKGLEIRPGETVELKPGGNHLMFLDLKEPLRDGQRIAGTLLFEKAGAVSVEYAVRAIGARGARPAHHH